MKTTYESPDMEIVLFAPLDNTNGNVENVSGQIGSYDPQKNWQ